MSNSDYLTRGFPVLWKQSTTVLVCREGNNAPPTNCRPIILLKFFSRLLWIVLHAYVSHYSMFNLNHLQHISTKFKSIITNLVKLPWLTKPLANFVPSIFVTSLLSTLLLKPWFFINWVVWASWCLWRLVANYVTTYLRQIQGTTSLLCSVSPVAKWSAVLSLLPYMPKWLTQHIIYEVYEKTYFFSKNIKFLCCYMT
jgi:hypothetical protein